MWLIWCRAVHSVTHMSHISSSFFWPFVSCFLVCLSLCEMTALGCKNTHSTSTVYTIIIQHLGQCFERWKYQLRYRSSLVMLLCLVHRNDLVMLLCLLCGSDLFMLLRLVCSESWSAPDWADCNWDTGNCARLVSEVQGHWPAEDQCLCVGWGWCDDRYTRPSGSVHTNTTVK